MLCVVVVVVIVVVVVVVIDSVMLWSTQVLYERPGHVSITSLAPGFKVECPEHLPCVCVSASLTLTEQKVQKISRKFHIGSFYKRFRKYMCTVECVCTKLTELL